MNLRLSRLAPAALFSLVAACSSPETPAPAEAGGTGGTGAGGQTTGGTGGAGGSGAGVGGTGSGGMATGGSGGMGAGGAAAGMSGAAGMCVLSAGAGAPGSYGVNPDPTWATVDLILTEAFPGNSPCASADCHGAGGLNPFQLSATDAAQRYMSITTTIAKDCGDMPVVTPGDPSKSALVKILKGACSCRAPRMPKGCDDDPTNNICMPDDYLAAIVGWVTAGAKMQ